MNEVRSHVECAVRLTDNHGTHAADNPRLSLNQGLANWRVNPGRWNRPLGTSGQKSEPAVRSGDLDFLWDRCIFTTEWRLLDIFDVFVLLRRMALWPWPLTFWAKSVSCTMLFMSDPHTNFYYPTTIGYWVTSSLLNIWSPFRYLKQSLRMRSITWPVHRRSPNTTRNNFLTPNCLFTIQLLCGYDDN